MKKQYILILLIVIFCGCEKVIDIDLNSSDAKVVIEGIITDKPGPYTVKVSKSTDYFVPEEIPLVSNARVMISDNEGNSEILQEVSPGIYNTSTTEGVNGRVYTLKVVVDEVEYTSISKMQTKTVIDSLSFSENMMMFGPPGDNDDPEYNVICYFDDTENVKDYYRVRVYSNNELHPDFNLIDDKFTDGNLVEYNVRRSSLFMGDTVKIELIKFDKGVYDYYNTLSGIIGDSFMGSSTPANPISNISNGAMGYFGALSVDNAEIVIE